MDDPVSGANDIYIENVPDKGDETEKWLAKDRATQLFNYEKIYVPAHTPTISGTKENVTVTANTPNQSQIEKLSNAAEKGDPAYLENFRGAPQKMALGGFASQNHGDEKSYCGRSSLFR